MAEKGKPFMWQDADDMVGLSTNWKVGLEASLLKWEQLATGDDSSDTHAGCGLCFVKRNRDCYCEDCPAQEVCDRIDGATPQEILDMLHALEL